MQSEVQELAKCLRPVESHPSFHCGGGIGKGTDKRTVRSIVQSFDACRSIAVHFYIVVSVAGTAMAAVTVVAAVAAIGALVGDPIYLHFSGNTAIFAVQLGCETVKPSSFGPSSSVGGRKESPGVTEGVVRFGLKHIYHATVSVCQRRNVDASQQDARTLRFWQSLAATRHFPAKIQLIRHHPRIGRRNCHTAFHGHHRTAGRFRRS